MRRLFGDSKAQANMQELSIEELIVLERYEEAESRLKIKLKANQRDLHAHLKLAEVYMASKQHDKAVEEYSYVASEYASDGFHDKAMALLARASKLRPLDDTLRRKMENYERAKRLEQSRVAAQEGLRSGSGTQSGTQRHTAAVELQQLWQKLSGSPLLSKLEGDQLRRLFTVLELVRVEPGAVLAERGSGLAQLALIGRGVVEAVILRPGGAATQIKTFSSGDVIGDAALLEHRPWPATYRVAEAATLLTLTREGLEQALVGNPDPRGFLDALRSQRNDHAVAYAVHQLGLR